MAKAFKRGRGNLILIDNKTNQPYEHVADDVSEGRLQYYKSTSLFRVL